MNEDLELLATMDGLQLAIDIVSKYANVDAILKELHNKMNELESDYEGICE